MAVSDFKTAFAGAQVSRPLLLAAQVRRTIYPFASTEDPAAWEANVSGTIPLAIAFEAGGIYFYDALDASTPADGISVIRSLDNYCYKISNMTMPDSVLAPLGKVEPDGDEDIGDAYIVNDAPTGEFATFGGKIAVNTIRGWLPITPRIGRSVYVEGDGKYYRNEFGVWTKDFAPESGSIRDADIVGGNLYRVVENSTTTTPPVSPAAGAYWRVGGSPTGVWAGHADELATYYEGDSEWTFIPPIGGMAIFDKLARLTYVYDNGAWVSQRGAIIASQQFATAGPGTTTAGGSGLWGFTPATAPTSSQQYLEDSVTITQAARRTGAMLNFGYRAYDGNLGLSCPALFRDNEANAVDWSLSTSPQANISFLIPAVDTASHVYKVRFVRISGSGMPTSLYKRIFTLDEYA